MGVVLKFFLNLILFPACLCGSIVLFFVSGVCYGLAGLIKAIEFLVKTVAHALRYAWSAIYYGLARIIKAIGSLWEVVVFATRKIDSMICRIFNLDKSTSVLDKLLLTALVLSLLYLLFTDPVLFLVTLL